jgi:hypothetical protein
MAAVMASTLQTLQSVDAELKSLVEPLWQRITALVGEFFEPRSLAGDVP